MQNFANFLVCGVMVTHQLSPKNIASKKAQQNSKNWNFANFRGWWSSQIFDQKQHLISTCSVYAEKSKLIFCKFSRMMVISFFWSKAALNLDLLSLCWKVEINFLQMFADDGPIGPIFRGSYFFVKRHQPTKLEHNRVKIETSSHTKSSLSPW